MNKIYINPPPADNRCECCGKTSKELKPFGKAGDPLVGDFDGEKLVKTFRAMLPFLTKAELDWKFRHHCGEDKEFYEQAMNTIEASWNCRECIILSDEDYFKKQEMLNTQKIQ